MNLSSTKLVVGLSGLALALTTAVGVASAEPDVNPIINTTCSYPQVMAALNAQAPDLAYEVNTSPMVQSTLQTFLASPPDARQRTVQQLQNTQWGRQYTSAMVQIANSCNSY
jgi:hemophore-related protein